MNARRQRLGRSVELAMALMLGVVGVAACARAAPTAPVPTPVEREAATSAQPVTPTVPTAPTPESIESAAPTAAISFTRQVVAFGPDVDARPGAWSPSATELTAYVVVGTGTRGTVGHLWTVDAEKAEPLWDSGDMEGPIARDAMSAWLADGTLVLARQDGMWVDGRGGPSGDGPQVEGQPRAVSVGPGGTLVFVEGSEGAWLAATARPAQPIAGRPSDGFATWSWSPRGDRLALMSNSGQLYVLDVAEAEARRVLAPPPRLADRSAAPPRWLADGRVLVGDGRSLTADGQTAIVHVVADPATGEAVTVHSLLGIPPNREMPSDASGWVSADGRFLLYPEVPSGETRASATWLYDFAEKRAARLGVFEEPVWSPTGDRVAFLRHGRLLIWRASTGAILALPTEGLSVADRAWSPDGRWLAYRTLGGELWVVASDGGTRPGRLADSVEWDPAPSWSADSGRLAASVADTGGQPHLELISIAWLSSATEAATGPEHAKGP